jgi:hypothetical protein
MQVHGAHGGSDDLERKPREQQGVADAGVRGEEGVGWFDGDNGEPPCRLEVPGGHEDLQIARAV